MPSHERQIEQIQYSLQKQELNELYWAIVIRNFAVALVIIFGPIFIYQILGSSVPATVLYFLAFYLGFVAIVPLVAKLMQHLGLKKMMALGNLLLSAYLVLLLLAEQGGVMFLVYSLLASTLYMALYWPPRHIDFAKFASEKKRGRQIGLANLLVALAKASAPLLGGLIVAWWGFNWLFAIAALLVLFASVPLFHSAEVYERYQLSWVGSFKKVFAKENRRTTLTFFFEGIEYFAGLILFPIFIFLVIGKLETIGWVTSVSLLAALAFTYLVGWASDKQGNKKVISFASVAHAFAWVIMAFIRTPLQFVINASFFRLAETANHLPMVSLWYARAKKQGHGIDEYIVFHEIAHNLGRLLMAIIVIVGFSLGFESWLFYFTLAGVGALFFRLIK